MPEVKGEPTYWSVVKTDLFSSQTCCTGSKEKVEQFMLDLQTSDPSLLVESSSLYQKEPLTAWTISWFYNK